MDPWEAIHAEITGHREAGSICDLGAFQHGRPCWVKFCTCGRGFIGRTLPIAGNYLRVHIALETTGDHRKAALAGGDSDLPPYPADDRTRPDRRPYPARRDPISRALRALRGKA